MRAQKWRGGKVKTAQMQPTERGEARRAWPSLLALFLGYSFAICAGTLLFATVFKVSIAKTATSQITSQYAVVSSRPKTSDIAYVLDSQRPGHTGLLYFREEDPFAKSLMSARLPFVGPKVSSGLRVFEFADFQATREVS